MVRMHPVPGKEKAIRICRAFAEGAPKGADCDVFYGVNETNFNAWDRAKRERRDWYYIDNSYFDVAREQQFRVTKNRVQMQPRGHTSDGKRFEALGLSIKPWRKPESPWRWLIVEQSESFMHWVAHDPRWLDNNRPRYTHAPTVRPWLRNKTKAASTLAADIARHDIVLTHSSAAAVEAVMAGVGVYVSPMSALFGMVCAKDEAAHLDERRDYLTVLADNQFSLDEIRNGDAWRWLNKA